MRYEKNNDIQSCIMNLRDNEDKENIECRRNLLDQKNKVSKNLNKASKFWIAKVKNIHSDMITESQKKPENVEALHHK
ncbi:15436_t:CDS:2, partial [Gigaspora rosea]